MKSIVSLFRQNTGRVNLGLVNWDSFQAGFRMLMRGDKFAGVTWDQQALAVLQFAGILEEQWIS
jgi:hypothetical protein